MLKAIVVDDEKPTADLLCRYLTDTGLVDVLDRFNNPLLVLDAVRTQQPDVLFLDIEMPGMSGLELAERLSREDFPVDIVFVTAYQQYAIEAFRVNAIDYIVKPVQPTELLRVLQKLERMKLGKPTPLEKTGADNPPHPVCICSYGGLSIYDGKDARRMKWPTVKCKELLAYLLYQQESTIVSKWRLYDLLWPGKEDNKSEINLRSTVFRLNRALSEQQFNMKISSGKKGYQLEDTDIPKDTFLLEQRLKLALHTLALPLLQQYKTELLTLMAGDFLADLESDWHMEQQAYYGKLKRSYGMNLAHALSFHGDHLDAFQTLQFLVQENPYDEELHERIVATMLHMGDTTGASQYYAEYVYRLKREMNLTPRKSFSDLSLP